MAAALEMIPVAPIPGTFPHARADFVSPASNLMYHNATNTRDYNCTLVNAPYLVPLGVRTVRVD